MFLRDFFSTHFSFNSIPTYMYRSIKDFQNVKTKTVKSTLNQISSTKAKESKPVDTVKINDISLCAVKHGVEGKQIKTSYRIMCCVCLLHKFAVKSEKIIPVYRFLSFALN